MIENAEKTDGLFLPSCYAHTEGINVEGKTTINGFNPTEMVGDWFFDRPNRSPLRVVDDCPEDLPCNPSCKSLVGTSQSLTSLQAAHSVTPLIGT